MNNVQNKVNLAIGWHCEHSESEMDERVGTDHATRQQHLGVHKNAPIERYGFYRNLTMIEDIKLSSC